MKPLMASANPLDPEHDIIDVAHMTNEEIRLMVKSNFGGYMMREHWYFGSHPLYKIGADYVLMQYHGKLYRSPLGQFHPDVKADLKVNWCPVGLDASNWARNYL